MAEERKRPRGREKNVTGEGHGLNKRGDGLGTGPVGSQDGYQSKLSAQDRDLLSSLLSSQMGSSSSSGMNMSDLAGLFGSQSSSSSGGQNISMQDLAGFLGSSQSSSYSNQQNISMQDIMSILGQGSGSSSSSGLGSLLGGGTQNSSQGLGLLNGQQQSGSASTVHNVLGSGNGQTASGSGGNGGGNNTFSSSQLSGGGKRKGSCLSTIILVVIAFFVLSFLMRSCSGGSSTQTGSGDTQTTYATPAPTQAATATPVPTQTPSQSTTTYSSGSSYFGGGTGSYSDWGNTAGTTSTVSTAVAQGSRDKYTEILGNGQDVVTIMVYMCGTDLESKSGMGTSDMMEMTKATIGSNVNLLVFTGGCSKWNNSVVSSQYNQIYQVQSGGLARLVDNAGTSAMTDPANLASFINYCAENFPANRNALILWDHGSGSVAGYGYDEKNKRSGSMSLAGIKQALTDGGVQFDWIGYDACLMATAENALMLNDFADYLIASEETEPGVGWYYTDWLTALSANTSMETTELGQRIVDSFVNTCAKKCPGQKTTLSVIDLAEFSNTVPPALNTFSKSVTLMLTGNQYQQVSEARYKAREFASSSKIDQVDFIDLALKMGTTEGSALAQALKEAIKYNRTSSDMSNAYGVAVYFPYRRTEYVDTAVSINNQIGVDSEFSKCIQEMAGIAVSGQLASGGSSYPFGSLFGGSSSSGSSYSSSDIASLLESFLGGDYGSMEGYSSSNTGFFSGRSMSVEDTADYIAENMLDADELVFTENENGEYVMTLSEKNWSLVRDLDRNVFFDDGYGFFDLGLDNIFEFDEEGNLIADTERTSLAINGQYVAYYHIDTVDDGGDNYKITGRVPVMLNGERADLILVFDTEHPDGYVSGASYAYADENGLTLVGKTLISEEDADAASEEAELVDLESGESETVETDIAALQEGDRLDFICDYYSYDGQFEDAYLIGETMTVDGPLSISDVLLPEGDVKITYRLTDIYDREYWTEAIEK